MIGYGEVSLDNFELENLKRFCARCRVLGKKRFPSRWSFKRWKGKKFSAPSAAEVKRHFAAQFKIGEQLTEEWAALVGPIDAQRYWKEKRARDAARHAWDIQLRRDVRLEGNELRQRYEAQRAKAEAKGWLLACATLERHYREERAVLEKGREGAEKTIALELEATLAQIKAESIQAREALAAQIELRRLELNVKLKPVIARPGRPPVQRDLAGKLIMKVLKAGGGAAPTAKLMQAAVDADIGWKAMEAAGKALGVKKPRPGGVPTWQLPTPN